MKWDWVTVMGNIQTINPSPQLIEAMTRMTVSAIDDMIARNPATGAELGRVHVTPPEDVAGIVARSRQAQERWAESNWSDRKEVLKRWWRHLSHDADTWACLVRDEVGKPKVEALTGDVIATLDSIRWTVRHGNTALRSERIGAGHQLFLQIPSARLTYQPVGVVGMIGTWNYPMLLNAPAIAQAVATGNGVVWKPSELAPLTGLRLQESFERAGAPPGLVAAVHGGGDVGRALVESGIDKGLFTGGVGTGRRVLQSLASQGVPGVAELSGFDAALIFPDAPMASTVKAITWGAFVGAGQTCVAVKRVYVVGDAGRWVEALATSAKALRVGDPMREDVDVGPLINRQVRERVHAMVTAAVEAGARVLAGGQVPDGEGSFYPPTVIESTGPEPERALAGIFGPVVVVRGVASEEEAIRETNASDFGLAASVWSRNLAVARGVADRLSVGMVTINEAVTPTMHASAPFGGVKASGHGRTRGLMGMREFQNPRTVYVRRHGGFRPQLFPYGTMPVERVMDVYRWLFH